MTALIDMQRQLRRDWCKLIEVCPPQYRAAAAQNAALEAADYRERLLTAESDAERLDITRRWLAVYA